MCDEPKKPRPWPDPDTTPFYDGKRKKTEFSPPKSLVELSKRRNRADAGSECPSLDL